MNDYPKENLSPPVHILEIGPRMLPSIEFFDQYPGANIVFVANEGFAPYQQHLPTNATTIEADVVDYLESNHVSIPAEGFDFILAVGIFGQPESFSQPGHVDRFVDGVTRHLKPGGEVIIEDHYLDASEAKHVKKFLFDKFQQAGFTVTESQEFIKSHLAQPGSFQLRAAL